MADPILSWISMCMFLQKKSRGTAKADVVDVVGEGAALHAQPAVVKRKAQATAEKAAATKKSQAAALAAASTKPRSEGRPGLRTKRTLSDKEQQAVTAKIRRR